MKFAIIVLMSTFWLNACARVVSSPSLTAPDVVSYSRVVQNQAADEISAGRCPIIGGVMMPDYSVMRDQSRVLKKERP